MRLVLVALAWLVGLVVAAQLPLLTARFWLGMAVACGVAAWLARGQHAVQGSMALLAVACLAGLRLTLADTASTLTAFHGRSVALMGVVASPPDLRDDSIHLRVTAQRVFDGSATYEVVGTALVTVARDVAVEYGDHVSIAGMLLEPGDFDTFSYTAFLARQGVSSLMRQGTLTVTQPRPADDITAVLIRLREVARSVILSALPQPQSGLLIGILLGNERYLSPQVTQAFRDTGLSHVIAISGFNMVVLSGAALALLRPLHARQPTLAVVLTIGVLALYTVYVGAGASVMRAAVMCSLLLIAPLVRRRVYLPASLAAAALFLTLLDPFALWDVGFQLSFAAVLGLTLWLPSLQRLTDHWIEQRLQWGVARWWAHSMADLLSVTFVAQIATLPLLMLYFQQVSVVSLWVNVLVLPVQAAILVVGLAALLLSLVAPPVGMVCFAWVHLLLTWTIGMVQAFASLPLATQTVYVAPVWVALFYGATIGGHVMSHVDPTWWQRLRRTPLRRLALLMAVGVVGLVGLSWFQRPDGRLHVRWLDAGRSSAVLLSTPGGAQILIDGGRYPTRLMTALGAAMPFNDREIDVLILTQPDDADSAALLEVLRYYRVGVVMSNGQPNASETQAALWRLLADVPHVVARTGTTLTTSDGLCLEVLHPRELPTLVTPLTESALVLRLTYGDRSVLLAGNSHDLNVDTSQLLSDIVHVAAPRLARTSELALIRDAQPSAVVVQLDRGGSGRYLLDELAAAMTLPPILRTDRDGEVHLVSDGVRVWRLR